VYGEKWLPAAEPLRVLALSGFFINIGRPCTALLAAQNKLTQEMVAQLVMLGVVSAACLIGITWGLTGVAWSALAAHVFGASLYYFLVYRVLHTRLIDLVQAVMPAAMLNVPLFVLLAMVDSAIASMRTTSPALYLLAMCSAGGIIYSTAFLLLPVPALKSEAERWRRQLGALLPRARKIHTTTNETRP
jgi:O-antigen/teichoic acid export membrane protein